MKRLALLLAALLTTGLLTAAPAFAAAPTITSFTPTSGKMGTVVTITGTNFSSPATVKFAGTAATSVTVVSPTTIKASVPHNVGSGPITVTTSGGSATSTTSFTVNPSVVVSNAVGPPTSTRTVFVAGFAGYEAIDLYLDTTDIAVISATSTGAGSGTITIPASTTPGTHTVTAVGRHSGYSAQVPFTVRTDWPQDGFDPAASGSNPYENVLAPGAVAQLSQAWRVTVPLCNSAPSIAGGVVYVLDCNADLHAYSAATGATVWSSQLGSADDSSTTPAVVAGVVYATVNGTLYALNAATGAAVWTDALTTSSLTSPRVVNGTVYLGAYAGTVYSIAAANGDIDWGAASDGHLFAPPSYANGEIYVATASGRLEEFDATTGITGFDDLIESGQDFFASPTVADGLVYTIAHNVTAVDAVSGVAQWSQPLNALGEGGVAVDGGQVFALDSMSNAYAFDAADGTSAWTRVLPQAGLPQATRAADGVVYFSNARTYALSESTGQRLRTLYGGGFGSVIADGTVTIGVEDVNYDDVALAHYALRTATAARPDPSSLRPNRSLHVQR